MPHAQAPGAEKKLLCLVPGKTATPRRLASRFRLRHTIAAGLFRPPVLNFKSHVVTAFAQGGDGGPENGTAPQSED